MSWFAAYTHAGKDRWARSNLWERDFEVYLPQYQRERRHARRTDMVVRPLFPRYLFVKAAPGQTFSATHAATAKGVIDLVRMGKSYPTAPDHLIEEIRAREGDEGYVEIGRSPLTRGQSVRIVSGSLRDHLGIFECRDDAQRVVILIDLLGRKVRTRVSAADVEPEPA